MQKQIKQTPLKAIKSSLFGFSTTTRQGTSDKIGPDVDPKSPDKPP